MFVAAASARPFVGAAAAAGHAVVAADLFCDAETRRDARQAYALPYGDGGFDAEQLRQTLLPLLTEDDAFVYGSGFETQPELLAAIAQRCSLWGNPPETVRSAKEPGRFFSLLAELGIPHPETSLQPPAAATGWLAKRCGGSGGTHVQPLPARGDYYQKVVPGRPCTLLFLADGCGAISVIGYNEQWLASVPGQPYLYGGAVSQARLPHSVQAGMHQAARELSRALGLRGLNSLDCMVDDERWWVLEVNPRLSATFALYDVAQRGARLFEAHRQACAGQLAAPLEAEPAQAHLIYYAPFALRLKADVAWPAWAVDRPHGPVQLAAGEPLCSVVAQAPDAVAARALAEQRAAELLRHMGVQAPE